MSPKMTKTRNLQTRIPNHADMKITALTDTRRNLVRLSLAQKQDLTKMYKSRLLTRTIDPVLIKLLLTSPSKI